MTYGVRYESAAVTEPVRPHPSAEPDPLDDLLEAAPERGRQWMLRKARLADGTRPGLPCALAGRVREVWERAHAAQPTRTLARRRKDASPFDTLHVGLLRDVAGRGWPEISARAEIGESAARRRYRLHREWMAEKGEYWTLAGEVAGECFSG